MAECKVSWQFLLSESQKERGSEKNLYVKEVILMKVIFFICLGGLIKSTILLLITTIG